MIEFEDLEVVPTGEFADRLEALLFDDLGLKRDEALGTASPASPPNLVVLGGTRRRRGRHWSGPFTLALTMVAMVALLAVIVTRREPSVHTTTVPSAPPETTTSAATNPVPPPDPTSTMSPQPSPQVPKATPGELAPGKYRITSFDVPFTFATESNWILDKSRPGLFDLITMTGPRLAVTSGVFPGTTALDVARSICPGAVDYGPPESTTLLGQPAIRLFGAVSATCVLEFASDVSTTVDKGVVLQVTVAEVDGIFVTVVAGALSTVWPGSEAEIEHIIASMEPII